MTLTNFLTTWAEVIVCSESAQVVETSVNVITNSPSQDYAHPDGHNLPTYNIFMESAHNEYYLCISFLTIDFLVFTIHTPLTIWLELNLMKSNHTIIKTWESQELVRLKVKDGATEVVMFSETWV